MKKGQILIVYFLILLVACSPKSSDQAETGQTEPEPALEEQVVESPDPDEEITDPTGPQAHSWFTAREPGDEEIREYGIITTMEDSGYPMYIITVSFPERQTSNDFTLNVESASLSHEFSAFQEQYATVYYESEDSNEVLDIIFESKSLLGEYAPEDHEGLETFEGVLKGAVSESGDLPGELTIVGEEGKLEFEYFVDAAVMAANDQQVTVYYYNRYVDKITYMELSVD